MGRGPSYPYVGLEEAIGLSRKMYDYAKRAPAQAESVVTEAWKYSATSSSGQKVLAALKAFGLIEDAPGTSGKSIKLTQRSIRILMDEEDSPERKEEIRKAALSPKWYEHCWKNWGKEMPPSMRSNLIIEQGFIDTTVDSFLRDYRKTIAFAGLLEDDTFSAKIESTNESNDGVRATGAPQIGDYVQWESQGVLRLPVAQRLTRYSADGKFAFVEDSNTGVPIEEIIPAEAPETQEIHQLRSSSKKNSHLVQGNATMLQETFSLPNGTFVRIEWPAAFTPEAFEDFSDWLNIVKRKIGRTVKQADAQSDPSSDES